MTQKFKVHNGLRVNSTDVIDANGNFVGGRLIPTNTTGSTSTTTGALVIPGGVGVNENLFVGGTINKVTLTQPANAATLTLGNNTTVEFPNSLAFPAGAGNNGYVLSTDGDSNLSWIAISATGESASVRYDTATQGLTPTQKHNAAVNIGLATVAETGSYLDLLNKPTNLSDFINDIDFLSSLPIASISTLGGVKIGAGLEITSSGVLSAVAAGFGNLDGGGPTSVYGGLPTVDGGGI